MNPSLREYEHLLHQLEHWPNKRIIYDITSFANRNERLANDVADILVSRILDVSVLKLFLIFFF